MTAQEVTRPTISTKELYEKRYLDKMLRAAIRYAEAKLRGFNFDAQIDQYGNVWRAVITVGYQPLPIYPQLVDGEEPEMYAVVKEAPSGLSTVLASVNPKAKGRA